MRVKKVTSLPSVSAGPPPIAIDFGANSLKILQISAGDNPRVIAASCLDTPDEIAGDPAARLRFQIGALPKMIRKGGFSTKRAVFVLPANNMFCKHMRLQLGEGVDAESMIAATLPSQIGCAYETLVCRHHEIPGSNKSGKTEIICMAASRDLVGRLMAALKNAKLEPVGVHSPFHTVLRAFDQIKRRESDASLSTMYIDIGYDGTNVMIANGKDLVFARTVDLGGRHLDEAICSQLGVPVEDARQMRWAIPAMPNVDSAPSPVESGGGSGLAMLQAAIAKENPDDGPVLEPTRPGAAVAEEEDRREGAPVPGLSSQIAPASTAPQYPEGVDLSESLEILSDEVAMCMRYHKALFPNIPIERAVLVGGESRQVWLCQALARGLRLSLQVGDPLSSLDRADAKLRGVDLGKAQPGWVPALGACLSPTDL